LPSVYVCNQNTGILAFNQTGENHEKIPMIFPSALTNNHIPAQVIHYRETLRIFIHIPSQGGTMPPSRRGKEYENQKTDTNIHRTRQTKLSMNLTSYVNSLGKIMGNFLKMFFFFLNGILTKKKSHFQRKSRNFPIIFASVGLVCTMMLSITITALHYFTTPSKINILPQLNILTVSKIMCRLQILS